MTVRPSVSGAPAVANLAGKFRPIAELGRGGMATVYLVIAQGAGGFNKLQVAKTLHESLGSDAEFVQMFLAEARLVARLSHPNVVQTYDVGFDGQSYCILMEYLEGQSLESIMRRGEKLVRGGQADGRMPLPLQLKIVSEMLAGLHYAHELNDFDGKPLNIVHRDVSPHNVIVTYDGHVKLCDFGIAKAADSTGHTRTGVIKGKVAYMAPEQFGGSTIDRRADIFAAGIVLWQAVTGERMWKALSEADIFKKLAAGQIPLARSVNPSVPEELEAICAKALHSNREERYQTAAEFQHELDEYIAKHARATSQQVGAWVAKTFADHRARIRSVIEQQVKKNPRTPTASAIDLASSTSLPQLSPSRESMPEIAMAGATPGNATSQEISVVKPAAKPAIGWRVVAGSCVVLALAVVGVVRARTKTAGATPTTTETPSGEEVMLKVDVTPPEATLYLDGVPLTGNTARRMKDGASHRVRAEAPGYRPGGELVTFDSTIVQLALVLEKETAPAGSAKRPAPSSTAPTAPVWYPPPVAPHAPSGKASGTLPPSGPSARPGTPPVAPPSGGGGSPLIDPREDPWRK